MKIDLSKNSIIHGDCLNWLPHIPSKSVDMCYIDPPFFTQRDFIQFNDKWKGGMNQYIHFISERVKEIHRVLKDTGSIFLHCDWHASHHLRLMLDKIFGEKNFINEIIWTYNRWTTISKSFQKKHDNIFFYSKTKDYKFNPPMTDHSDANLLEYRFLEKENGEIITLNKSQCLGLERIPNGERFREIRSSRKKTNKCKKKYFKDNPKIREGSVLKIKFASNVNEKTGYAAQKPEALLKKIVECSTNQGDLILDCFGGSGTTAAVALKLRRKFITGDISKESCELMESRLVKIGPFHVVS